VPLVGRRRTHRADHLRHQRLAALRIARVFHLRVFHRESRAPVEATRRAGGAARGSPVEARGITEAFGGHDRPGWSVGRDFQFRVGVGWKGPRAETCAECARWSASSGSTAGALGVVTGPVGATTAPTGPWGPVADFQAVSIAPLP